MRTIKASEFKAKCLQIMDEVAETGEPVVITKNGVPITEMIPVRRRPRTLYGSMKGTFKIVGDVISSGERQWDALRE